MRPDPIRQALLNYVAQRGANAHDSLAPLFVALARYPQDQVRQQFERCCADGSVTVHEMPSVAGVERERFILRLR